MNPKTTLRKRAPTVAPLSLTQMQRLLTQDLSLEKNPLAIQASELLEAGKIREYLQYTELFTNQLYGDPGEQRRWAQLACFLKKYPFQDDSLNPKAAALEKFRAAEHRMKLVNRKFRARRSVNRPVQHHEHLERARKWICSVIGEIPDLQKIWGKCDFGPGASVGIHGQATHKARKLESDVWTVTPTCIEYARSAMIHDHHIWELLVGSPVCYDPGLFREAFDAKAQFVTANKIVTVPKTAMTERTIAIEPLLNGYIQKGVDEYMREKLLRVGIDLTSQGRNQRLARIGSFIEAVNPYVTIDLSAASDSVSKELVKLLLPPDWYAFLNNIRSPEYILPDGSCAIYEKFVSMGNGFCFPLESLIFAAFVQTVYVTTGEKPWDFAVYGDDIIVRQSSALLLKELLEYVGFRINVGKTFWFGPFKESCGADYYNGEDVRPLYLDSPVDDLASKISLLNALTRKGLGYGNRLWTCVYESVGHYQLYVRPFPGPDTAIEVPMDVFMGSKFAKYNRDLQSWRWREITVSGVSDTRSFTAASEMYGLLRGGRSRDYHVDFTYRRKTRTVARWVPTAPTRTID